MYRPEREGSAQRARSAAMRAMQYQRNDLLKGLGHVKADVWHRVVDEAQKDGKHVRGNHRLARRGSENLTARRRYTHIQITQERARETERERERRTGDALKLRRESSFCTGNWGEYARSAPARVRQETTREREKRERETGALGMMWLVAHSTPKISVSFLRFCVAASRIE